MSHEDKQIVGCENGAEMWRDNVLSYGFDEAVIISRSYLDLNLKRKHPKDERQFCHEVFAATYESTAGKTNPRKLVYPYDFNTAEKRGETDYYHNNRIFNTECARGIDNLIKDSCYKSDFYNLEIAAMLAIHDYGFPRVCMVLAFNYLNKQRDARFTAANMKWVNGFPVKEKDFGDAWLQAHATLIDGFCWHVRELYQNLGAEYFVLPGNEEHGEFVKNVKIVRAITTSNDGNGFSTGYAIGHNPKAVEPWVCWQFAVRDGERHYNWGIYGCEQTAIDAYNARVFVALN